MRKKNWFLCLLFSSMAAASPPPCQTYMNGEMGAPTPPASPYTRGSRLIVTADFLWWIARENLLEYVFNVNSLLYEVDLPDSPVIGSSWVDNTRPKEPEFKWDPGFRVGLGYRLPHDFWEGKTRWTRFHTNATSSSAISGSSNANAMTYTDGYVWMDTTGTTPARGSWDLSYDLLEAGLSRSIFLGQNLSVDLQFGAVGGWIDQSYKIQAPNLQHNAADGAIDSFTLHFSNDFRGGGLFLAIAPQWEMWNSLSILGNANAYILHGGFDIKQNWFNGSLGHSDMSIHKDYSRNRAGLAGKLGLQWESCPLNCSYHFSLALAYEGAIWFKQNLLSETITLYFENFERRGDLEMQGITFSARADF